MAGKYGRFIPETDYKDSMLERYLWREEWEAWDGILLLSGLSPEGTDIAREGPYALQPLDAAKEFSAVSRWFYAMERKLTIEMEPLGKILDREITEEDEEELMADMRKACEELLGNFEENEDAWKYSHSYHNGSPGDRFPQEYLIKWAKDKRITVPWLEWAEKEGLLHKEEPPVQTDIAPDPRPEKTPAKETVINSKTPVSTEEYKRLVDDDKGDRDIRASRLRRYFRDKGIKAFIKKTAQVIYPGGKYNKTVYVRLKRWADEGDRKLDKDKDIF